MVMKDSGFTTTSTITNNGNTLLELIVLQELQRLIRYLYHSFLCRKTLVKEFENYKQKRNSSASPTQSKTCITELLIRIPERI